MIVIKAKGDYKKAFSYFERLLEVFQKGQLDEYGRRGVAALKSATPVDTGKTADSWTYQIDRTPSNVSIVWSNDNVQNGFNIAIGLQYGHGTIHGGYVEGRDYINPAIRPIFDEIAQEMWREVTK